MGEETTFRNKSGIYPQFFSKKYQSRYARSGNYYTPFNNYHSRNNNDTHYMNGNFNQNFIPGGGACETIIGDPTDTILQSLLYSEPRIAPQGTGVSAHSRVSGEWNKTKTKDVGETIWKTFTAKDTFYRRHSPFRDNQSSAGVRQARLFHHESPTHGMYRIPSDLPKTSVDNPRSPGHSHYSSLNLSRTRFSDVASPLPVSLLGLGEVRPRYQENQSNPCLRSPFPKSSSNTDQKYESVDSFRNNHSLSPHPVTSRSAPSVTSPWRYNVDDLNRSSAFSAASPWHYNSGNLYRSNVPSAALTWRYNSGNLNRSNVPSAALSWRYNVGDLNRSSGPSARSMWRYNVVDSNRSNYHSWSPRFSTNANPISSTNISRFESDDRYKLSVSNAISLDLYFEMRSKYLNSNADALYNMNSGNVYASDSERNRGPLSKISSGKCFQSLMSSRIMCEISRLQRINRAIKESTKSQLTFKNPELVE